MTLLSVFLDLFAFDPLTSAVSESDVTDGAYSAIAALSTVGYLSPELWQTPSVTDSKG